VVLKNFFDRATEKKKKKKKRPSFGNWDLNTTHGGEKGRKEKEIARCTKPPVEKHRGEGNPKCSQGVTPRRGESNPILTCPEKEEGKGAETLVGRQEETTLGGKKRKIVSRTGFFRCPKGGKKKKKKRKKVESGVREIRRQPGGGKRTLVHFKEKEKKAAEIGNHAERGKRTDKLGEYQNCCSCQERKKERIGESRREREKSASSNVGPGEGEKKKRKIQILRKKKQGRKEKKNKENTDISTKRDIKKKKKEIGFLFLCQVGEGKRGKKGKRT